MSGEATTYKGTLATLEEFRAWIAGCDIVIAGWSETQIQVGKVWAAIGARPLFGTRCGKRAGTIWATFFKREKKSDD